MMILPIISIGNSRGIRLPKTLLAQMGVEDKVRAELRGQELVLSAPAGRAGWADAFAALAGRDAS